MPSFAYKYNMYKPECERRPVARVSSPQCSVGFSSSFLVFFFLFRSCNKAEIDSGEKKSVDIIKSDNL